MDVKGYKSLKRNIVERFLLAFQAKQTQETFEREFEDILRLFGADVNAPQENVQNEIPKVEDPLKAPLEADKYALDVLQVVLYRLVLLQSCQDARDSDKLAAKENICEMLKLILTKEKMMAIFYASFMLNISRSYIDNDNASVERGNILARLSLATSIATMKELEESPFMKYIQEALSVIGEIYKTEFFNVKLNEFMKFYGFGEADHDIKQKLATNLKSIVWLHNAPFAGMVGLNMETYLNLTTIADLYGKSKNEKKRKRTITAYLVSTILHQDAHHIVRIKQNNFLSLTPNKEKQWEAGDKFESMLFGAVISDYDEIGGVHTVEGWKGNKKQFMLDEEEIKIQEINYKNLNLYMSGICAIPQKLWIK